MKKHITNIITLIFAVLTMLSFINHFSGAQSSLIMKDVTKGKEVQLVELAGQNKQERKENLEKLFKIAKSKDEVTLVYQDYKNDTIVDYYTTNVKEEAQILKMNDFSKVYKIKPFTNLLDQEDKLVLMLEVVGSNESFISEAQQNGIIAKNVLQNSSGSFETINYQAVFLFYSIIIIASIISVIYRTKENALRKIHGASLLNRVFKGYIFHFVQQLLIITGISFCYYILLRICKMEEVFLVYQQFIFIVTSILFIFEGVGFCAIELFSTRAAIKNKMPKTFLLIGIVLYKFLISLLTISIVALFSYNMQVAIDDVRAYAVYDKMSEYKAISYINKNSMISNEDVISNKFSNEVYPILAESKVVYFDSNRVGSVLETIRNGNLSKESVKDTIESKVFPVNDEYIQQFVNSKQKEAFFTKQEDSDIVAVVSNQDREKMKEYETDKSAVCDLIGSANRELCQKYKIKFIYYDDIELMIPNPFFQNAPEFMLKRPVLLNVNSRVVKETDSVKLTSVDGFLSSIFIKEKDITAENKQKIAQIFKIDKINLVDTATGYEEVISQGKAKLQRASTDLVLFSSASILLSIFIIIMFIEEYKKKIALERFAGKSWFSKYGGLFSVIILSWIIGFFVKSYLPFDTILFKRSFQEDNAIFYITMSVITCVEILVLLISTRFQEKKAITKILKNE